MSSTPIEQAAAIQGEILAPHEGLRRGEASADDRRPVPDQVEPDQPRLFLERQRLGDDAPISAAEPRQHEGGADIGVAGKRQLGVWGEYPHLDRMPRVAGGKDESRFREIELGRDGLHLRGRKAVSIEHDRQRIASEPAIGENVSRDEIQLHPPSPNA